MLSRRDVLLSAAGLVLPPAASAGQITRIPFTQTRTGLPRIAVSIAGRPCRFVIDTGAAINGIRETLARDLGWKPLNSVRLNGIGGSRMTRLYRAERLAIGGSRQDDALMMLGFDALPFKGMDGLLGARFLTAAPSELDFTAGEIRIHAGTPDFSAYRMLDSSRGDVQAFQGGQVTVKVRLDGMPLTLLVDTGATAEIGLNGGAVARLGLWKRYPVLSTGHTTGATGAKVPHRIVKIPDLDLGAFRIAATPVRLTSPMVPDRRGDTTDGVIGIRTLRRFGVCFAGAHGIGLKTADGRTDLPYIA